MKEMMDFMESWRLKFSDTEHKHVNPIVPSVSINGESVIVTLTRGAHNFDIRHDEVREVHDFLHELLKRI